MDVAAILIKAQKEVKDFEMRVTGEISKTVPTQYTSIHVIYDFKGPEESNDTALKAFTDSQEN